MGNPISIHCCLGSIVRNTEAIAGATILGDGRAALILDVPGVIRLAARK